MTTNIINIDTENLFKSNSVIKCSLLPDFIKDLDFVNIEILFGVVFMVYMFFLINLKKFEALQKHMAIFLGCSMITMHLISNIFADTFIMHLMSALTGCSITILASKLKIIKKLSVFIDSYIISLCVILLTLDLNVFTVLLCILSATTIFDQFKNVFDGALKSTLSNFFINMLLISILIRLKAFDFIFTNAEIIQISEITTKIADYYAYGFTILYFLFTAICKALNSNK